MSALLGSIEQLIDPVFGVQFFKWTNIPRLMWGGRFMGAGVEKATRLEGIVLRAEADTR